MNCPVCQLSSSEAAKVKRRIDYWKSLAKSLKAENEKLKARLRGSALSQQEKA